MPRRFGPGVPPGAAPAGTRPACPSRGDPGPGGPCGRRWSGARPAGRHAAIFPPPFQREEASLEVAEDPADDRARSAAEAPVRIVEALVFSHADIIPEIPTGENTITSMSINPYGAEGRNSAPSIPR